MNTKFIWCGWLVMLVWSVQAAGQAKSELSAREKKVLELSNAERKQKGLKPLQASPSLGKIAGAHAKNMAKQGKLEHVLDGKNPLDRLRDAGYKFSAVAENVARLSDTASVESVMKMWMESKIHRDNILDPDVTEIGVGIVNDGNGQVYFTQLLAAPR